MISASPGLLGGVKSQLSWQIVLTKLGVHVIPDPFAFGAAHQAFGAEGGLRDATAETAVRDIGAALTGTLDRAPSSADFITQNRNPTRPRDRNDRSRAAARAASPTH